MPENVLNVQAQWLAILGGVLTLLGAALAFSFKYRATSSRGAESGHRPADTEQDAERVSPDGFIDSFAGVVSEAGGGMPYMAWVIMSVVLACYFVYLFLYWNPGR
jgi:hypothetical protein